VLSDAVRREAYAWKYGTTGRDTSAPEMLRESGATMASVWMYVER
jgi:hypothetical protein